MEKIDLHIHTNLSDGDLGAHEIAQLAKRNECYKIAITDHEIFFDYNGLAHESGIEIVNGIEFNTDTRGMHILGYGMTNISKVNNEMEKLHKTNEAVSFELIEKLQQLGYNISKEQIDEYLNSTGIRYKYLDKRHIVKYLIKTGYVQNVEDAYTRLIGRGTNLYIPLKKVSSRAIIDLINDSGGVSVLAHPGTLMLSDEELYLKLKELRGYGLDGLEISNRSSDYGNETKYRELAKELELLSTVGSDFHALYSQKIGVLCEDEIYYQLCDKIKIKHKI